jgi:phosphoribosylamine-glycine ligase
MTHNKLFTIVKDENDPEGQSVTVEPTEYLAKLGPPEVINVLRAYVNSLAEDVEQYFQDNLEKVESLEKSRTLVFELEVAQRYLAQVFKG